MSKTPVWAEDLIKRVLTDEACQRVPILTWRRAHARDVWVHSASSSYRMPKWYKPVTSSGRCSDSGEIVITAGTSRLDAKLVLLHELAHFIVGPGHNHDLIFWTKCFLLYFRYRVKIGYAVDREKNYRKGSIAGYRAARRIYQSAIVTGA